MAELLGVEVGRVRNAIFALVSGRVRISVRRPSAMLEPCDADVFYGKAQVLHGICFSVALAPEDRRTFSNLTAEENLRLVEVLHPAGFWARERVYQLFPRLAERR